VNARAVPGRGHFAIAALVCATLIAYASLYPFAPRLVPWQIAWRIVMSSWPPAIGSKTDFISNVLLQTPLGFLIAGALAVDRPTRRAGAVLGAVVSCAALALVLEMAQVSIPARSPQFTDIVAETLGGLAGASVWVAIGDRGLALVRSWWQVHGSRLLAWLLVYAAAWAVGEWMPLDVTIRPAEVAAKYRAGLVTLRPATSNAMHGALLVAASLLLAWPLGRAARLGVGDRPHAQREAVLLTSAWILAVGAGQLAVLSRESDLLLMLCALVGGALGVFLPRRIDRSV
jgi:VanZ family protein